jgi:peptide/nickel transport system substrate-binding protein
MTGHDILFSIESYALKNSSFAPQFEMFDVENSTVSDCGLIVTLKTFYVWGPGLMASPMPVISKEWALEEGWASEAWFHNPMGSGPYYVTEFVTGSHVVLNRKENFWGTHDIPYEQVNVRTIGEASVLFMELEAGSIDLAIGISNLDYRRAQGTRGIETARTRGGEFVLFSWNMSHNEVTANRNVRKALTMAVDWNAIAEMLHGDLFVTPNSIVASSSPFNDPEVPLFEFNPELALQILAEEGVDPASLNFRYNNTPVWERFATSLQGYLTDIGVSLDLEFMDFATRMPIIRPYTGPDLIMTVMGTTGAGEPQSWLRGLHADTATFASNHIDAPEFIELMAIQRHSVGEEREEALNQLQWLAYENYWVVPMWEEVYGIAFRSDIISGVNFTHRADSLDLRMITFVDRD